jgi:hypothetical protein
MRLPSVTDPERYRGLYVYDFGAWSALGYTAEEIAVLLESDAYGHGKAFKIVRATPDGQLELRGVPAERFQVESGMFFTRSSVDLAEADFDELVALARAGAPCRAYAQLADRGPTAGERRFVTALIYPAEYEDEMSRWLLDADYAGGELAEGGPSHVTNYFAEDHTVLRREQFWSTTATPARERDEVLASVRQAVQR